MGLFQVVVTDQAHVIVGVGFIAFRGLAEDGVDGFFAEHRQLLHVPVIVAGTVRLDVLNGRVPSLFDDKDDLRANPLGTVKAHSFG